MNVFPYWRLSGFYFFNCLVLGFLLPFWGLYMTSLNYSPEDVAGFGALLMSTNIIAPCFWGWLSDKVGHRVHLIQGGALLSVLSFATLYQDRGIGLMLLAVGLCSFCWQGINSQFEVVTLGYLKEETQKYSRIRLWGSVGFAAAVIGGGSVFDFLDIGYLPYFVIVSLALMSACTFSLRDVAVVHSHDAKSTRRIWPVLRKPSIWGPLLVAALAYFSHGTYYGFYSIYLEGQGIGTGVIGGLWGVAVFAELAVFALIPFLMKSLSLRHLVLLSLLLTSMRWAGIGLFVDYLGALIICQLIHGFSFGALHACLIEFVYRNFSGRLQGRGQAVYYAICVGLGQAAGILSSGWLWEWSEIGSFMFSSAIAALALLLAIYFKVFRLREDSYGASAGSYQ